MATRSTIAVVHNDGRVSQVYCHWDGYLEGVGRTLVEHYGDLIRAEALVELGDISSLDRLIEPTTKEHSFDTPERDVTVFYGRDRREDGTEPQVFDTVEQYLDEGQTEEFNYVFQVGQWFVAEDQLKNFVLVERSLKEMEE